MAIYFVGEYPSFYEELKNKELLKVQKEALKTSMTEVDTEMNGFASLLTELDGKYSQELASTFNALVNEVMVTYSTISEGLEKTLETMDELSGDLGVFKEKDEELVDQHKELKTEQDKNVTQYEKTEDNENVETDEYKNWQNKMNELKQLIEELKEIIFKYRDRSDEEIDLIDQFNNSVVNIRLKMAAMAFAQDGLTLEEIKNLSVEEREKLIQDMIDAMTVKYNEYKEMYEAYSEVILKYVVQEPALFALVNIYGRITGETYELQETDDPLKTCLNYCEFLDKVEKLKTEDGRNLIECLKEYSETKDFAGSGLQELYLRTTYLGYDDKISLLESGKLEDDFWSSYFHGVVQNYDRHKIILAIGRDPTYYEVCDDIYTCFYAKDLDAGYGLKELANNYKENYYKAVEVGTAVHGLNEFKGHIKYDMVYLDPAYKEFKENSPPLSDFLVDVFDDGFNFETITKFGALPLMTRSELEMFRYLYETKGLDAAKEFEESIELSLKKREGVVRAANYYYELIEGDNYGLEAVWDHLSAGGTGFGDGVRDFCDGILDVVAPSKELSADEYAQIALISMLTEGGTGYDNSLLAAYGIGNTLGGEAIPIVVSLVNPTVGKVLKTVSSTGNAIEDYYRADDCTTYWEAFAHAGLDLASTEGIEAAASLFGLDSTPLGKVGVAALKNTLKTGVDYVYDPSTLDASNILVSMTNVMKGDVSGALTDMGKEMFSDYLQNVGWPEGWADATADLFEPAISNVTEAGVDAVDTFGHVVGDNLENGGSVDAFAVAGNAFVDGIDLSGAAKEIAKDAAKELKDKAEDAFTDTEEPIK